MYYPAQTLVLGATVIRKERAFPPGASGKAQVRQGAPVQPDTVVLSGSQPGDFVILDALAALGINDPSLISQDVLQVRPGERIQDGQPIFSLGSGRREKVMSSPIPAVFIRLDGTNVILRRDPVDVEVRALLPGSISSVKGETSVTVETIGAFVQGGWGNGKEAYATLTLEPEGGIESLAGGDDMVQRVQGTAIILTKPITSLSVFTIAQNRELAALVAPSMPSALREIALRQPFPVLLTEGFGDHPMSEIVYNVLRGNANRPAGIDARTSGRWSLARPDITVPLSTTAKPPAPEINQPVVVGAKVRLTRAPHAGHSGRVYRLPTSPRPLENGLLALGAEVQLTSGEVVFVPLANLELLGRPLEAGRS
ncbi:MAG TPA: hypothetical protein PLD47_05735 [Aggregatilineales bacterium]|nr:hypothetical protein [Aggregatilineales bacterium]